MKKFFQTKMKSVALFSMSIGLISLTACDYEFHDSSVWDKETLYFDFSTSSEVNLHINYGSEAANALLYIYEENPLTDALMELQGEPIYKVFADANGRVDERVSLPNGVKKVYVYSPSWNAPQLLEGEVKYGALNVTWQQSEQMNAPATRASVATRAGYQLVIFDNSASSGLDFKGIVDYKKNFGKIVDVNGVVSKGQVDAQMTRNLQRFLWNGSETKPYGLNNSRFAAETSVVNTGVNYSYVNGEGQTVTVDGANVSMVFLTEQGWYESAIGYYYYPSDQVPTSPKDVTLYLAIPNVSIANQAPYGVQGNAFYKASDAPMANNTKIDLLYVDEEGNISKTFPSGYTIGYFILPDAFTSSETEGGGKIEWMKKTPYYSNKEWNSDKSSHFISMNTAMGVVYGIEDGGDDKSFEDVLFIIDANPIETIQNPNRPTVEVSGGVAGSESAEFQATEVRYKNYAFEDHWPEQSDYDMNDVIIRHSREIVFGDNNKVKKVTDVFTPVQPAGSATRVDAFAVQYTSNRGDKMTLPEFAVDETATQSVILFNDARSHRNKDFTVVREFTSNHPAKTVIEQEDLNPFIILDYQAGAMSRTEVHLPKHAVTKKANAEQLKAAANMFFVSADGNYPYAIELPIKDFQPVTERVNISKEYLNFNQWVLSSGAQFTDWYKHYEKQ